MKAKKILSLALAFVMLLGIVNIPVFAQAVTEVANETQLVAAIAAGGNIKLTGNITTSKAITTAGVTATIDLNGYKLTIGAGDNKFNDASDITIKNGKIDITGVTVSGNAIFCLDEYEETLVTTLTLDDVDLIGNGYSSAYGVFYIGDSSVLNVNGGEWNLSNDTHAQGGVFKADDARATLNISGTKMTLHDVRRVVTYAATTIENSTLAISGDPDGVDAEMEHGFNRSPLTIKSSIITMKDMVGRGITAEEGKVIIEDTTVTMQNVQEATIDVRKSQTVSVDEASNVIIDEEPTVADGCTISGDVTVTAAENIPTGTLSAAYTSESTYYGECGGNANESFEFKFYNGTTYMGYTSLNNVGNIIDGDVYVTWHIKLDAASNDDEYWTMAWEIAPTVAMQPNRVEQWVDGVKVAECAIKANGPDDLKPVFAAVTDNNGKILSYITRAYNADGNAELQNALSNGGNIALIADVKLNSTLSIPENTTVNLDLNGKTISGNIAALNNNGTLTIKGDGGIDVSTASSSAQAINNYGTLTIDGGTYKGTEALYSYTLRNYSTMTVNNANLIGGFGGIAMQTGSTAVINDGTYSMTGNGGGHLVYLQNETELTVNGGTFTEDIDDYNIWTYSFYANGSDIKVTFNDGDVTGLESGRGMAINGGKGTFVIKDGNFTGKFFATEQGGSTVISGGTFSVDVTDFLAEGYTLTENEDGTYGVKAEEKDIFGGKFAIINMKKADNGDYMCAFGSGIDSLNYKEVGFTIYSNGEKLGSKSTRMVYSSVSVTSPTTGKKQTVTKDDLNAYRIFYLTVQFAPKWDNTEIQYQPYAVTLDGEIIYGDMTTVEDIYTLK